MTPTLGGFFEAWEIFRDPTLAGTVAGGILGFLGVYVVLRRLVFLSAAVSQAAGLGVALSFYFGLPAPTVGATILTMLSVLPVALEGHAPSGRRDGWLGLGYLLGAAGTLAIGTRIVEDIQDIQTILFGSAVAVTPESLTMIALASIGILALHLWWGRGFTAVSFDPAGAAVRGLPVRMLELALFGSLALGISVSTRVIGALPTFAFSLLAPLAALRLSPNIRVALTLALIFGAVSGFLGYLLAYLAEFPVGASQTLIGVGLVALAEAVRPILLRIPRPVDNA